MATNTYIALNKVTVTSATPSITFNSIPQGYTDLVVVMSAATTHTLATFPYMRFNTDAGTNYSVTELYANGTSATFNRGTNTSRGWIGFDISISNTVGDALTTVNIMSYSDSSYHKIWAARSNRSGSSLDYQGTDLVAGLWRNTAAITSLEIRNSRGDVDYNFAVGSVFSLYGIKANTNAESTVKATGGIVYSDNTYYYHAFPYSGTFTPAASLSCDILTIAGGGSGSGQYVGGGGGAGGVVYNPSASLSASAYTVTIGAGGAAITTATDGGNNGSNTTFGALTTAYGGGRGGYFNGVAGASGGSGGGGGNSSAGSATQGTSSITFTAYGNAGGAGTTNASGGGGGAGAAGSAQTSGLYGGLGGLGLNTWASWMTATNFGVNGYIGNGGSGANHNGYGAAAGNSTGGAAQGVNGYPSTGGGGGGTREAGTKGSGGSGLVIVRYLKA